MSVVTRHTLVDFSFWARSSFLRGFLSRERRKPTLDLACRLQMGASASLPSPSSRHAVGRDGRALVAAAAAGDVAAIDDVSRDASLAQRRRRSSRALDKAFPPLRCPSFSASDPDRLSASISRTFDSHLHTR